MTKHLTPRHLTRFFSLILLSISLLFISCKEDEKIEEIKSSDNKLTVFSFLKEHNESLKEDIHATITDGKIDVELQTSEKNLIATFKTVAESISVNGTPQVSGVTVNDFSKAISFKIVAEDGSEKLYSVNITWVPLIAQINVVTDGNVGIDSKDEYIRADITITANGWGEDFSAPTRIRGRGNSTWGMPKKPYRVKLDDDASILGLAEEKDWILLANFIDPTLMLNAVAFKIGQLLDLKYTNNAIPVDLTINGNYAGSYMLTEQIERSKSRVDIHKTKGVLLELDTNFDEDVQFISNNYNLPVMVKEPDPDDIEESERNELFNKIMGDFHQLEDEIASDQFPNTNYKEYIDIESVVKYLIIFNLTHNMEINHPKSVYMYKDEVGKYFMGPIWDFDWCFDYEGKFVHFGSYDSPLFGRLASNSTGYDFFTRFLEDPEVKGLYKEMWNNFSNEKMSVLLDYVEFYSSQLKDSQAADYAVWKDTPGYPGVVNYEDKINQLTNWLQGRASYIDNYVSGF